jgi:Tetracyclin repressor-like, C-terminal domain
VVSASAIIRGGCGYFLRHGTVEMVSLASSLSISRATLYRVVHSRDRLLGDVLWQLGEQLLAESRAARTLSGPDGVLEITRLFFERVLNEKRFRDFLRAEPEVAARVLFTPSGGVHARAVAAQREILLEVHAADTDGAARWLAGDVESIAYLYVSIVEAVMYAELFGDRRPDRQLAERAARALLLD